MKYNIPEQVGISSANVLSYYRLLEEKGLSTHAVYIARGDEIISFAHWKPFTHDFSHRMYSETKSFVAIAIGFCLQDGLLDLDDPILKYFPEGEDYTPDENVRAQTIRSMLIMSTAKPALNWFNARSDDRVRTYFNNPHPSRKPFSFFEYDSSGSFVLGALVERVTGKVLTDYLREKLFSKIGVSKEAHMLKCPGGHSWGDSALLCTSEDVLRTVRFMANGGAWHGEQILDASYVKEATTFKISTAHESGCHWDKQGYGYQIWLGYEDSFFFNGMGCQFGLYMPKKDMILVYNGDNQGNGDAMGIIFDGFKELIYDTAVDEPLPNAPDKLWELRALETNLHLMTARGDMTSPMLAKINGKTYVTGENPMGITRFAITIVEDGLGSFAYTNAQGEKCLYFGMGQNVFGDFPETGYAKEVGSVSEPGHKYHCATSAAWLGEDTLYVKIQIIDDYFGNIQMHIRFREDGTAELSMRKVAEDFLQTYHGDAVGAWER